MRVCREYLPNQESALRRELTKQLSGVDGVSSIDEAQRWLEIGEVRTALDILIMDKNQSHAGLIQAADIVLNQSDAETAMAVGGKLGTKLVAIGENSLAAQVYLQADKIKEAVNALVAIGDWIRARRIVNELAPELESYLEDKYQDNMIRPRTMKINERIDDMETVSSIESFARKGQWIKVFDIASTQSPELLHKYVAQRAAQLLKSGTPEQAIQLYTQFGIPSIAQYHNLYYQLSESILNSYDNHLTYELRYEKLAKLRNFLLNLTKNIEGSVPNEIKFQRLLRAAHYSAVKLACQQYKSLSNLSVKLSISLLRYTDILLADRCYYETGIETKKAGLLSEAFVFLNHFLDLEECIQEGDGSILDIDDLRITDFPLEVPLPVSLSITNTDREEVKEWILAISMDQGVEQGLPVDSRGVYIGSLTCPANGAIVLQECSLTGYPIRGSVVTFEGGSRIVDRDDWNKIADVARQDTSNSPLNDVISFVQEWCGNIPSYSSF